MKHTLMNLYQNALGTWKQTPALRWLLLASAPVLFLGVLLGGIRTAMLLTGYLQLVFRAALPGEPVENNALQRAAAFTGGLTRMLFFTGMMTHAAWPFLLMAGVQALGLLILHLGEQTGTELSLLPMLAAAAFLLLGLAFGVRLPAVWSSLSGGLALTLLYLLLHGKRNLNQLRMRFHLA